MPPGRRLLRTRSRAGIINNQSWGSEIYLAVLREVPEGKDSHAHRIRRCQRRDIKSDET